MSVERSNPLTTLAFRKRQNPDYIPKKHNSGIILLYSIWQEVFFLFFFIS